jgi:tetratricopeptide (TPR) repeat protein
VNAAFLPVFTLFFFVCCCPSLVAQTHDLPRLQVWLAAVNQHTAGKADAPALAVWTWTRQQLQILAPDVRALLQLVATGNPGASRRLDGFTPSEFKELQGLAVQQVIGGANRLRKRGAMLHADIASLVPPVIEPIAEAPPPNARGRSTGPRRSSILSADGRFQSMRYPGVHWDFARTLLDGVTPDPSHDETVQLWYRATSAFQINQHNFTDALPHLERARQVLRLDPRIFLASGGVAEMLAAPRIQGMIRTTALPNGVVIDVPSERSNLRNAEGFYRRALELDPGLTEARIRLARVLGLQGRHEEAIRELQRADSSDAGPLLQYCAALFLGADEEALGHVDRAREAFGTASALYPNAQSPYLALSRLAWRTGDRAGALGAIRPVLALSANQDAREDPWWQYFDGTGRDADALLDRLHRVFQAGGAY